MRASRILVLGVSRGLFAAKTGGWGAIAAAALLGASIGPAGAAVMAARYATAAAIVRVADPVTVEASPKPSGTPKRSPTSPVRGAAQPLIPPAALPGLLSASPQPRGPLPLETVLLPLAGVTAGPEPSELPPAPDRTKPPAP